MRPGYRMTSRISISRRTSSLATIGSALDHAPIAATEVTVVTRDRRAKPIRLVQGQ